MHSVVGLCGKEVRIIVGLGPGRRKMSSMRLRNSSGDGIGTGICLPSAITTPH